MAAAGGQRLINVYESLVQEGALRQDESQHRVAKKLGRLSEMLRTYKPPPSPPSAASAKEKSKDVHIPMAEAKGGDASGMEAKATETSAAPPPASRVLRGMYIHGKVRTFLFVKRFSVDGWPAGDPSSL